MNEDVHLKLLIPCVAAGAIIGKGGEAVEKIKRQTGARLKMSKANDFYPGTVERVCVIVGSIRACMQLTDYIMRKVSERPEISPCSMPFAYGERHNQLRILVPNTTAGIIIGKSGSFIKQIKEKSGAVVHISQKSKDLRLLERCIIITGDLDERRTAMSMILSKIAEDPHSGSCPNCSYTHMQTNGAYDTSQPPPAYMIDSDSPVSVPTNEELQSVGGCPSDVAVSFNHYGTGANSVLNKESLTVYRDPGSSTVQASLSPILFTFTAPDVGAISPPSLGMIPSAYRQDFTQMVLNHTPKSGAIPPASHLLTTPGAVSTSSLSPSAAGVGCTASLLASFCRPKLIPLAGGTELSVNGGLSGPVTPSATLPTWLSQAASFNPIRLNVATHQPIPVEFLTSFPESAMLPNGQLTAGLRMPPHLSTGFLPTANATYYPGVFTSTAQEHAAGTNLRPVQTDFQNWFSTVPSGYPRAAVDMLQHEAEVDAGTDESVLATATGPDRSFISHTRYCSGESTDSALTASLTSLRLHSSVEEQAPDHGVECSSSSGAQRAYFSSFYQQPMLSPSTGSVPLLRLDTPYSLPAGNHHPPPPPPHPLVACSTNSSDFGLLDYSYMIPQALSSPLSSAALYGTTLAAPIGSTSTPACYPANPFLYALPGFGISADSVGLPYPTPGTGIPPPVGMFTSPNELASPGLFHFRYNTSIINNTPAAGIITSSLPSSGGGDGGTSSVKLPSNRIEPVTQMDSNLFHSISGPLVQQYQQQQQQQQRVTSSPQSPSGLLLVGTIQQVQQALSVLRTRMNTPHLPTTDCLKLLPSPPMSATTSFVADGPLRVDRIQPLSVPPDWIRPPPSPVHCTSQNVM
ncbi:RNA-binding protein Nova-1 [Fasciola gigantica]|uniref:RNA-binding protein Nova-1 n=1 Tax=Fasciola gigantica TaxID=46835 RepID=A0A504Y898_FASGI|nr:RNA-binding protein Nova-1 [Fasciola gigantica]